MFLVVELNPIDLFVANDLSATAGSSSYPRTNFSTYNRLELSPAYPLLPPQPIAGFCMCTAHPMAFHFCCHPLGAWPHHACSLGVPAMHSVIDHPYPQHLHLPSLPSLTHPASYSLIPHPDMLYPSMVPQRGWGEEEVGDAGGE